MASVCDHHIRFTHDSALEDDNGAMSRHAPVEQACSAGAVAHLYAWPSSMTT